MFNMIHHGLVVKVDCVVRKDGEYRRKEFSRRRSVIIDGTSVAVVAPEDLILSKLEWAELYREELLTGRNLCRAKEAPKPIAPLL